MPSPPPGRRILLVQTAYLGDLVLTTPLVRELARSNPGSEIAIVSTALGHDVFYGLPGVRETIGLDKRRFGIVQLLRVARRLRARPHDVAVLAHRSHRSAILAILGGSSTRLGFADAPGAWAYTASVPRDLAQHAVRRYLALARPLGGAPEAAEAAPRIGGLARGREPASRLLGACGIGTGAPFVALAPGSVWPTKRWTPEGFATVASALQDRGAVPLLVGAAEDAAVCRTVSALVPGGIRSLAGRTTVAELAAVLERARACVANDSGASHVASAVGTPVVSVFGPTTPALGFAPAGPGHAIVERAGLDCRPCTRHGGRICPLGHFRCMREIAGQSVVDALLPLLERRAATVPAGLAS